MRCIAPLIVTCLLLAGAAPRQRANMQPRHGDAIAAAKALVKLAVRRTDAARPVGKLGLDPIALPSVRALDVPPRLACDGPRATPRGRMHVATVRVTARGPPRV